MKEPNNKLASSHALCMCNEGFFFFFDLVKMLGLVVLFYNQKKKISLFFILRIYFLDNVLVGVRVVFLPNCLLVLSLHKHRGVRAFLNQKNEYSKQEKPLK